MVDAPPVARTSYRFRAAMVEVETDDALVGRWLAELVVPWFAPVAAACGTRVRWRSSLDEFAQLAARQASASPIAVPCFSLDSELVSLPGWTDEPGCIVAFDATFACFYRMRGPSIEVVARPGERKARIGLLRVVREALTAVASSEPLLDLHAAAFAYRGRAVLAMGEKNAGKTTVLAHALASGQAALLASDRVMVAADAQAHGVPTVVSVRAYTLQAFPNIAVGLPGEAVALALEEVSARLPDEQPRRARLSPAQFAGQFGARLLAAAPIGAIVFPQVAPHTRGCVLRPVAPGEGAQRLREGLYARRSGPCPRTWAQRLSGAPPSGESPAAWAERLAGEVPLLSLLLGPDAYREPAQSWLSALPMADEVTEAR